MPRAILPALIAISITLSACAQSGSIFPELGDQLATPSALAVEVATGRLYVVNSNSKVLYDWTQGTFQAYDITDPLAPAFIKSTATASFSGQVYVDTAKERAFVPNRFSESEGDTEDRIYSFYLNEAATDFLGFIEGPAGLDAYAIDCCYPADRAWVTTSLGELQYVNLNDIAAQPGVIDLKVDTDTGGTLSHAEVNHIARRDNQAFLSREYGGVLIVNLDDAGVAGAIGVDYYIRDIPNPRGIAIRDDTLYVVGEGNECDNDWCRYVMVLDVSALVALADNPFAYQVDKEDAGILVAIIEVGKSPQEILLSQDFAFVTNQEDDNVSVIDLATNAAVAAIGVGDEPFSLALYTTPAGVDQYLYVGNVEDNTISIIDVPTLSVAATYNGPQ